VRRDHVAGGIFIVAGTLVLLMSQDLPFGTLSSPGAGMLPSLLIGLMIALGVALVLGAGVSPPASEIAWEDLPHALKVIAPTCTAIALYTIGGFLLTMGCLLFFLTCVIERRPLLVAAAFSIGVPLLTNTLFGHLLNEPLPRGLLWF
jgi:hypothetical protein